MTETMVQDIVMGVVAIIALLGMFGMFDKSKN